MPYKDNECKKKWRDNNRDKINKSKKKYRDKNREKIILADMKYRCLDPNCKGYKYWGGRGIKICDRWLGKNGFKNFYADMGKHLAGKTLDRKNNDGNYCKKNCRWATSKEQNNNKRDNRLITYKNKTQTIAQWARELNLKYYIIYNRLRNGWSVKRALET